MTLVNTDVVWKGNFFEGILLGGAEVGGVAADSLECFKEDDDEGDGGGRGLRLCARLRGFMLRIEALSFLDWEAVSLEVAAGEVVSIQGESGSGKSLLLRAVADLIPHGGEAYLNGRSCSEFSPTDWRRQVSFLSAEALWWEDVVRDHFLKEPDEALLERLGLKKDCLDWEVTRLSMGERQRLGLLRMMDREPVVLLLDEPTANLDEKTSAAVEGILMEYLEQRQACCIWVTHDTSQARRVGDRAFQMESKRMREVEA